MVPQQPLKRSPANSVQLEISVQLKNSVQQRISAQRLVAKVEPAVAAVRDLMADAACEPDEMGLGFVVDFGISAAAAIAAVNLAAAEVGFRWSSSVMLLADRGENFAERKERETS